MPETALIYSLYFCIRRSFIVCLGWMDIFEIHILTLYFFCAYAIIIWTMTRPVCGIGKQAHTNIGNGSKFQTTHAFIVFSLENISVMAQSGFNLFLRPSSTAS